MHKLYINSFNIQAVISHDLNLMIDPHQYEVKHRAYQDN